MAGNRHLDARGKALANRLLVEADHQGFPLDVLNEPIEARSALDWRQRYAGILNEVLQQVEREWSKPTGLRRADASRGRLAGQLGAARRPARRPDRPVVALFQPDRRMNAMITPPDVLLPFLVC